jgi:hypothetical protein
VISQPLPQVQRGPVRNTVFSWTRTRFPFHVRSAKKLAINEAPIITVTGKAYFDIDHAPKDQSNRRKNLPGYAAWEIHLVLQRLSEFRRDTILPSVAADYQRS